MHTPIASIKHAFGTGTPRLRFVTLTTATHQACAARAPRCPVAAAGVKRCKAQSLQGEPQEAEAGRCGRDLMGPDLKVDGRGW